MTQLIRYLNYDCLLFLITIRDTRMECMSLQ